MFELMLFAVVFFLDGYLFVNICNYYGIVEVISMAAVSALFLSTALTILLITVLAVLLYGFIVTFFSDGDEPPEE